MDLSVKLEVQAFFSLRGGKEGKDVGYRILIEYSIPYHVSRKSRGSNSRKCHPHDRATGLEL